MIGRRLDSHLGSIEAEFKLAEEAQAMGNFLRGPRAMHHRARAFGVLALAVPLVFVLAGCAVMRQPLPPLPGKVGAKASPCGWWYARFAMNWPESREPSWYLDPLLAHRVISPVLERYRGEIRLWRFHRRAARDQAGHQFSFIIYSSPETARHVFAALQSNPLLGELKERGVLIRELYDDSSPGTITRPNVEDTSDRHWPLSIQKSWPFYIQGVSEMWLNLVAEMAGALSPGKPAAGVDELLRFYETLNSAMNQLWRQEGQHAFLHHLNALFGYEPLMIREKRLMDF